MSYYYDGNVWLVVVPKYHVLAQPEFPECHKTGRYALSGGVAVAWDTQKDDCRQYCDTQRCSVTFLRFAGRVEGTDPV